MHRAAKQTALDYFAATQRRDFGRVAALLYPGDLDKFKTNTLWCATAMAPFGESGDFLRLFGGDAEVEDLEVLSPADFLKRFMDGALGTIPEDDLQNVIDSFRIEAMHQDSDTAAVVEYSFSTLGERAVSEMRLQRVGDEWFVLLKDGFMNGNRKVKARVEDFNQRASRDLPGDQPDRGEELEAFPLWGFRDLEGQTVIEPRFAAADDFSEGLAPVKYFRKWGFINPAGESVIAPRFDRAEAFSEGLAAVARRDQDLDLRWGFIDLGGRLVIDFQFHSVEAFEDGTAEVEREEGDYCRIDPRGKVVEELGFDEEI